MLLARYGWPATFFHLLIPPTRFNSVWFVPLQVLSQLFEQVRRRDSFALIRPEMVVANEYGDVSLQEISEADQGSITSSAFMPPEMASAALLDAVDAEGRKAAYVWNLGVTVYALLAGYPPFASTSVTECPFFADFATSHRLACPPHFSTAAIELLLDMLCVEPAGRIRFEALDRSIDEWRRSAMVQTEPDIERKTMIRARSDSNVSAILAALALRSSAPPSARLSSSAITATAVSSAGDMAAAQTVTISAAHPIEIPQVASALSGNVSRGLAPACGWALASARVRGHWPGHLECMPWIPVRWRLFISLCECRGVTDERIPERIPAPYCRRLRRLRRLLLDRRRCGSFSTATATGHELTCVPSSARRPSWRVG